MSLCVLFFTDISKVQNDEVGDGTTSVVVQNDEVEKLIAKTYTP